MAVVVRAQVLLLVALLSHSDRQGSCRALEAAEKSLIDDINDGIQDAEDAARCLFGSGACDDCLAQNGGLNSGACYFCPGESEPLPGIRGTSLCYHLDSYEDVFHSDRLNCDGLDFNVLTCSLTFKYLVIIVSLSVGIPVLLCVAACVGCCLCCCCAAGGRRGNVVITNSSGEKIPLH